MPRGRPTPDPAVKTSITELREEGGELEMDLDTGDSVGMARITAGGISRQRPALSGPFVQQRALAKLDEGYGLIPVNPVAQIEGMPFTGPSGLLVDYSSFITDRPAYDNLMTVRVLQREGAPASVTDALSEAGLSVETTLAQERRVLDQSAYALALRLYAVVAALVVLMALAGLFVSNAVQLPARRRDAAALRVVGVPRAIGDGGGGARAGRRTGQCGDRRHPRGLAGPVGGAAHDHARVRRRPDHSGPGRGDLAAAAGGAGGARGGGVRGDGPDQRHDDGAGRARGHAPRVGSLSRPVAATSAGAAGVEAEADTANGADPLVLGRDPELAPEVGQVHVDDVGVVGDVVGVPDVAEQLVAADHDTRVG